LLSGCTTTPQEYSAEKTSGQWEAKLQIADKKEKKTYNLSLDVVAEKPNLLRAEISGSFGVALASMLLEGRKISYALHRMKRYYSGISGDGALEPVLQVRFDPAFLMNVFFDEPIRDGDWSCQISPDRIVENCVRSSDRLMIQWLER